jgi:hypothetical protein
MAMASIRKEQEQEGNEADAALQSDQSNDVLSSERQVFDCAMCHAGHGHGQPFEVRFSCECTPRQCANAVHWTKANGPMPG